MLLYLEENFGDKIRSILKKINNNSKEKDNKMPLNQILYGPPGTGKTYNTINKAIEIANPDFDLTQSREKIKAEFDRLKALGQIVFTTFHQSMSYEDFIEGIKPKTVENRVVYNVEEGIFTKICLEATKKQNKTITIDRQEQELTKDIFKDFYTQFANALVSVELDTSNCILKTQDGYDFGLFRNSAGSISIKAGQKKTKMSAAFDELASVLFDEKQPTYKSYENKIIEKILEDKSYKEADLDNTRKPFVLIIDEINRGNVSQIFGELITLIEEDKRLGKDEALEVTLPYSKKTFGVPPNLYIIGTMNTADRSVEALDTALRRRFRFEEMLPKADLIKTEGKLKATDGKLGDIDLVKVSETINDRIEVLLSRDNLIGHSYFLNVETEKDLKNTFFKNIIPLLQEYFYGDYGKIGLVLGDGFVKLKRDDTTKKVTFAACNYEDTEGVQKRVYAIESEENVNIQDAIKRLINA